MKKTTRTVEFNENTAEARNTKNSQMSSFLVKHKIVKNAKQASLLLLCIAVVFIVASLFILSETQKKPVREYSPDPASFL